jgi:hypothetical protein
MAGGMMCFTNLVFILSAEDADYRRIDLENAVENEQQRNEATKTQLGNNY